MKLDVNFEGGNTLDVKVEENKTLDITFEDSEALDTDLEGNKTFDVEFESSESTFNSDFGETFRIPVGESESVIAMSIEGHYLKYIKADGSEHCITIPDDDTKYSLGTDTVTGLTKIYATTGSAVDGTMTQKAITDELNKKVSVSIDDPKKTLIFSTK